MKKIKSIIINIFLTIALFQTVTAQKRDIVRADSEYDKYAYFDAIEIYKKVVDKGYESPDLFKKIGNSYYFNAELKEANIWYEKLFSIAKKEEIEPEYYYRYSHTLKSIENYTLSNFFLDEFSKSGENFFLAYGLYRPHVPFVAPKKYFDLYDSTDFTVPQSNDTYLKTIPEPAAISVRSKNEQVDLEPDLAKEIKLAYYATTSFMDAQIGLVLDKLKATGLDKNTIVVFTSDHGYHLGEHGHWQKQTLFEDATRVTLIISGPNVTNNNKVIDSPVELIDLYPTIMDVVDFQSPSFVSGKSLFPYFSSSDVSVRTSALTELRVIIKDKIAQGYGIQTNRYRLNQWRYKGEFSYELYDHKFDKFELENLANNVDYLSTKDSLVNVIKYRISEAKIKPLGLGKQIDNAMPSFEPKRFFPKQK